VKNLFVLFLLSIVAIGGATGFRTAFPPPPADYEVVYFGSPSCGVCQYWKSSALPDWKKDSAASHLKLTMTRLNGNPFTGGYGAHDAKFKEVFGKRRSIAYPSFVLYSRGEIERIYVGINGWEKIEKRVRTEAKRMDKRDGKDQVRSAA